MKFLLLLLALLPSPALAAPSLLEQYDRQMLREYDESGSLIPPYELKSIPPLLAREILDGMVRSGLVNLTQYKAATSSYRLAELFSGQAINLSGDAMPEWIIIPSSAKIEGKPYYSGPAACTPSWVYAYSGGGFRKLLETCAGGSAGLILPLDSKTQGWRDLIVRQDSPQGAYLSVFKYDRTGYKLAFSDTIALPKLGARKR